MDHFGQDFLTWLSSLVWNLPLNSSVFLDFACAKNNLHCMDRLREDEAIVLVFFSEHVGQTKIFRGSPWKCRASATA